MTQAPQVGIIGLKALRRDLDRLANDQGGPLARQLVEAGRQAAEPVAAAARESLPRDTGTLAGDVRVSATRTGAAVRMGRKAVPYAGPVEFGGWPEGREYIPGGRYLFPAAHALANSAASLYAAGVQRAIDGFNWTNETNNPEAIHD